ncbi:PFL_4703 family integrating conjugative element protein [Klebsiella pneumoniae]|uniref:PFL_4703 family integrating conjugative element protein n=1 Tax=Klebsiella pneumoniae TaxID=573 RepID=UPI00203D492B|nr:TIGR03746 family integrating conjugative element protein [Klebsiella pneumoniae]USB67187.1 TIGR03746 family integrating conjugative element protein [Klebsiella pneumoniae]
MRQFKHALAARDAHIVTLRLVIGVMLLIVVALWYGWQSTPRNLTIHNPPDLRAGSTRPWWEIPPGQVYAFSFYIFQQLNRWPVNGEEDYPRNLTALRAYLTPSCLTQLEQDNQLRRDRGELRERVRGVYEIPGRGFHPKRVQILDRDRWIATLDLTVDEYYRAEPVKRALVRYPLNIVRYDVDAEKNPWGLVLDCFASQPQKLEAITPAEGK